MACNQAYRSAEAYQRKHKAEVDELFGKAHGVLNKQYNCGHEHEHGAVTKGTINNTSRAKCVRFFSKHDWSGHNNQTYPHCLAKGESGTFVHASRLGQVDEAAVVYTDELGCAWLVAWSVTDKPDGYNKVFVETGLIEKYKVIDWSKIKEKLDVSMDTTYWADYDNHNEAFATITTVGNKATLAATFNATK